MATKRSLVGFLMGMSPEEETGVAPPAGRIIPGGSYVPGRTPSDEIKSGPIKVWPRKPSKDKVKRDKNKKFAV